jgi:hypothetical protein
MVAAYLDGPSSTSKYYFIDEFAYLLYNLIMFIMMILYLNQWAITYKFYAKSRD